MRTNALRRITRRTMLGGAIGLATTALLAACGGTKTRGKADTQSGLTTTAASAVASANLPTGTMMNVVATTTQIQDFVKNVGGTTIALAGVLKPNVDPHDYEPTVNDANAVAKAQIVFVHGIGLDNWMGKAIKNASAKAPVVVATEGVTALKGDANDPEGDPHVWFDPTLVKMIVTNIATALAKADPANATTYQANAKAYSGQLDQMDAQVTGIYNQVPKERRKLVTNHDAFKYLAKHYDLTIVGAVIPSVSDTAEPSAKQINDLVATIKKEQVKAIFAESSANPKVAQQVAQETGITIVDNLYGDTLGAPGSDGETYLKMMVANATAIVGGLK